MDESCQEDDGMEQGITRRKCLIAVLLLLGWSEGLAQKKFTDNLSLSVDYHYGLLLPEYSYLLYLVEDNIQSASVTLSKRTTGRNVWEHLYKYPEYGVSLFYSTLGNDKAHGREIALFPFFNLNIISRKKIDFYSQTGLGLSYVTRKFDLTDNYLNVAVGSHLNIHFTSKLGISYKMPGKIHWQTGISFDHFSNSNMKEPNLGLNYVSFYTGLKYAVGEQNEKLPREIPPYAKRVDFELIYSAGGKHPRAVGSKKYFTSSGTFELKWKPLRALHFGVGADIFYDNSTEAEMLTLEMKGYQKIDDFRTGIHFSQQFVYDRLSLIIQEGFYLLLTDKVDKNVMYNRGIVRYRVSEHAFVQLAMKSHLHILDYPELGLGFKW
jgi:hypothetical protein